MKLRDLDTDFVHLALEHGRQQFLPVQGPPYEVLRAFGIFRAGMSFHRPPFEICRARPQRHCVFLCAAGEGIFHTRSGETRLRGGEWLHIPPGCPNRYWTDTEFSYIWADIEPAGHWRGWEMDGEVKRNAHYIDQLVRVTEAMIEHDERWGNDEILTQWVGLFVSYLERELLNQDERAGRLKAGMSAVWREVKINPARKWRMDALAAMAHMSVTHFKRTVREVYGVTAGEMLASIRLGKALTLMHATDLTLDRVAELSGYSTSFALSKACRRVHGTSPRKWAQGNAE